MERKTNHQAHSPLLCGGFFVSCFSFKNARGVSLIEAIVGIGLVALIFWGLVGAFLLAINLTINAKAKTGALSIAIDQLEMLRSLSYDDVGTDGGIPSGTIPQVETVSLNDIEYTRRTFIQFVDNPADGVGANDDNGITADYKVAKVEITWDVRGKTRSLALVTNIVPRGIETIAGGGTLIINVINALGIPVEGASVRVVNNDTNPVIDVTTTSNASGQVLFPGAPEANSYEVTVTKAGYSSAQTYSADATNVAPSPAHLSILESTVSEITFAIDFLSEKTVETYEWLADNSFDDDFTNSNALSSLYQADVIGGSVALGIDGMGDYYALGGATSTPIAPAELGAWESFSWSLTTPAGTDVVYQVLYEESAGNWTLIPDSDLPGNSVGFSSSPVDLSGLSTATYPGIEVQAVLTSSDPTATPLVHEWSVSYEETVPLPNIGFHMQGTKTIGSDSSNEPIYKYSVQHTTDGSGELTLQNLEWDTYAITVDGAAEGYDIRESCPLAQPRPIDPGVATTTLLYLVPHTTHALNVSVVSNTNEVIEGASVNVERTGYDETELTSACGQAFFAGLTSASNYTLTVTAPSFENNVTPNLDVNGYTTIEVVLTPQ